GQVQAGGRRQRRAAAGDRRALAAALRRRPDGRQHPGRGPGVRLPWAARRRLPARGAGRAARPAGCGGGAAEPGARPWLTWRWAEVFVVAPLDANTLAKLAAGLCDNCLTCVWRAWEPTRPVVLAPAMNTLMWQHPTTGRHLRQLAADAGAPAAPLHLGLEALL